MITLDLTIGFKRSIWSALGSLRYTKEKVHKRKRVAKLRHQFRTWDNTLETRKGQWKKREYNGIILGHENHGSNVEEQANNYWLKGNICPYFLYQQYLHASRYFDWVLDSQKDGSKSQAITELRFKKK